ncbi:MAG: hypothetical protein BJ554DRAFT_6917, partial [Olpidium bornovanus]
TGWDPGSIRLRPREPGFRPGSTHPHSLAPNTWWRTSSIPRRHPHPPNEETPSPTRPFRWQARASAFLPTSRGDLVAGVPRFTSSLGRLPVAVLLDVSPSWFTCGRRKREMHIPPGESRCKGPREAAPREQRSHAERERRHSAERGRDGAAPRNGGGEHRAGAGDRRCCEREPKLQYQNSKMMPKSGTTGWPGSKAAGREGYVLGFGTQRVREEKRRKDGEEAQDNWNSEATFWSFEWKCWNNDFPQGPVPPVFNCLPTFPKAGAPGQDRQWRVSLSVLGDVTFSACERRRKGRVIVSDNRSRLFEMAGLETEGVRNETGDSSPRRVRLPLGNSALVLGATEAALTATSLRVEELLLAAQVRTKEAFWKNEIQTALREFFGKHEYLKLRNVTAYLKKFELYFQPSDMTDAEKQ